MGLNLTQQGFYRNQQSQFAEKDRLEGRVSDHKMFPIEVGQFMVEQAIYDCKLGLHEQARARLNFADLPYPFSEISFRQQNGRLFLFQGERSLISRPLALDVVDGLQLPQ
jgi:hypothetical protein